MPMIPIEVTSSGELRGVWPPTEEVQQAGRTVTVARMDVGGLTYSSSWFQYCGVQQYEGAQPGVDANNFMLASQGAYDWMGDIESGARLTVDMFEDYREWGNGIGRSGLGKPAVANWRVPDEGRAMPVQVLRSPEVPKIANGEGQYSEIPGDVRSFFDAATDQSFMAWLSKCTHFCCAPGFKTLGESARFGGENAVYCQCHQSIYDPFSPVRTQFIALPRPEE
jgi:nitrite reductase/ring-hydroxylating ferredoxin subunit